MDLSFDGEHNFNLPDPAGKLDFTEDEDRKNECVGEHCNEQCAGEQCNEQCDQTNDALMSDDQMDEESDIEDGSNVEDSSNAQDNSPFVEQFTKPLVNQNLMLNKKPGAGSSRNPLFRAPNAQGMQEPVTPALIKRKQFKQWFNSPTDNCLSPCTQKIFKQKKAI